MTVVLTKYIVEDVPFLWPQISVEYGYKEEFWRYFVGAQAMKSLFTYAGLAPWPHPLRYAPSTPKPKPMTTTTAILLQSQDLSPVCAFGGHPLGSGMESVSMGSLMPGHGWHLPRASSRGIPAPNLENLLEEAVP